MIWKKLPGVIILAIICGIILSVVYINPYDGQTSVSSLILQLSGARANFQLGISLNELLAFCTRMVPGFLLELYLGTNMYRHFCTASVYVFSRTGNRFKWYLQECLIIVAFVAAFQMIMPVTAIGITSLRYKVSLDSNGLLLLGIHYVIYVLWVFAMTLLLNILSLSLGCDIAVVLTIGGQCAFITLLSLLRLLEGNPVLYSLALKANPVSHLVVGWHTIAIKAISNCVLSTYAEISFLSTFYYMSIVVFSITIAGCIFVCTRDLIVSDAEFGTI